ncbi:MAG: hypothetical protein ACLTML_09045 [Blautia faecis]
MDFVYPGVVSRLRENPDSFIYEVKDFFARMLDVLFRLQMDWMILEKSEESRENIRDSIREMKFLKRS